jgi:zinc/manganese transport system permease protein
MIGMIFVPFLACALLTAIHGYFGLHVLRRGIIFLDIALAQLASFGAVVAAILGIEFGSLASYGISVGFTMIGAVVFTMARSTKGRIPQEAIIGIVYVVAAAASIVALSRIGGEGHHLKEMMIGNILFVWPPDLIKTLLLYLGVGLVHLVFRRQFWAVSTHDAGAPHSRWWDFAFYASFGVVVTSSVKLAGVFLVFMLLVAPAVAAFLLSDRPVKQLAIAWIFGTGCSGIGLIAAVKWDFPPGAAIVVTAGLGLILTWGLSQFQRILR